MSRTADTIDALGPIQMVAIGFDRPTSDDRVLGELIDLVERELIRVLDLAIVSKHLDGDVTAVEFSGIGDVEADAFVGLAPSGPELIGEDDLVLAAADLLPGSSALLLVWEDVWAGPLASAVRDAGGVVLAHERVPLDVLEQLLAAERGA